MCLQKSRLLKMRKSSASTQLLWYLSQFRSPRMRFVTGSAIMFVVTVIETTAVRWQVTSDFASPFFLKLISHFPRSYHYTCLQLFRLLNKERQYNILTRKVWKIIQKNKILWKSKRYPPVRTLTTCISVTAAVSVRSTDNSFLILWRTAAWGF